MIIKNLIEVGGWSQSLLDQFKNIFFKSASTQVFSNKKKRTEFFNKWTEFYMTHYPDEIYLAFDNDNYLLGYLTGCSNTPLALARLQQMHPTYELFEDQFESFESHLHINCHPESRGQGVGTQLVDHYVLQLTNDGRHGIHIITHPEAKNRDFYKKNFFNYTKLRIYKSKKFLFMGRSLKSAPTSSTNFYLDQEQESTFPHVLS